MPRCKALARGGSRQCRRNALKGQEFCSIHGGGGASPSSRQSRSSSLSYAAMSGPTVPSRTTRASHPGSLIESIERSGFRGQKTRRVLNPAFTQLSLDNPLVQHFIADKVGDLSRSANVGVAMNAATMPMLYGGGAGLAAKIGTSIVGTVLVSGYLNTVDQYRDLAVFASTGKIHGYSLMGETHS